MAGSRLVREPTNDTAADAERVLIECLRRLGPTKRLRQGCAMSQRGRRLAMEAIRRRDPAAGDDEVRLRSIELAYGSEVVAGSRHWLRERRG
jgi:hypothetical protein